MDNNRTNWQKEYKFEELCQLAGVPERTVRYYINQGWLPPSDGSGRAAGYNRDHLMRLLSIRYLNKVRGEPLAEIHKRLQNITSRELADLYQQARAFFANNPLAENSDQTTGPVAAGPAGARTLNLLAEIRANRQKGLKESPAPYPAVVPPGPALTPIDPAARSSSVEEPEGPIEPPGPSSAFGTADSPWREGESWQRITLAPEVELHFKHPASNDSYERYLQIMRLLEQARKIFGS